MKLSTDKAAEPIAIIGSGCRLPGKCGSPSKLWELLQNPVDLAADVPTTRFNAAGFFHENAEHSGTTNATKAYFLDEDPWAFDNDFFSISVKEAESMDPQQRIMLEIVYESIESAGYTLSQLKGSSVGVFVGQMTDDYRDVVLRDLDCHPRYAATGTSRSIVANRISYVFDWHGPSVNVDTACSSSLVALHQAVQALRSGECDMALVAGVNLLAGPEMFSFLSSLHMLSPNGRSRMWDIDADGYARGEGFAAVVIKRLERAEEDGDDIEVVIRNTGVNQDGGRSTGLTVPSGIAQAELIRSTYARCGLDCQKKEDRCQYFEAHGTGTKAGDPREAEGISSAFFPDRDQEQDDKKEKLSVGSVKTIIGHLEGTAGLASLLKASLAVRHGLIPPNMHFNQLNPAIEPFYERLRVAQLLEAWPELPEGVPRRASVNSFGFGGTNAHAIVECYDAKPSAPKENSSTSWGPFLLSAHSENALAATIASLSAAIKTQEGIDLSQLAWTLQTRRTVFPNRTFFSANTRDDLIASLDSAIEKRAQSPLATKPIKTPTPRILGVFTGQGAQWASMGAGLYQNSITFRNTIQQLDSVLKQAPLGPVWSLAEELLQQDPARVSTAEISQPLCTALQVALVDLLRESGISFKAVVGHSSGEIGAAYAAGIIGARDAILIAYYRGCHSHKAKDSKGNSGRMMAVGMSPEDAEDFCQQPQFLGRIGVAAINSPSSITLSGDAKAIAEAKVLLDETKTFARVLKVDTAYHSHHMQSVRDAYFESLRNSCIEPQRNSFQGVCNWYSSVYKTKEGNGIEGPIPFEDTYWVDNMVNPVLFSHAVSSAVQNEDFDLALEIGPHPALQGPAMETIRGVLNKGLPYHGVLKRGEDATISFSNALGFVWANIDSSTSPVDFAGFRRACDGPSWVSPKVQKGLPSYPWDHNRSMLKEAKTSKVWRNRSTPGHPLLGWPTSASTQKEVRWRNVLRLKDVEWLHGHQFQGQVLFPAAGYLVMAVDAARHLIGDRQPVQLIELQDVEIHNGVTLEEDSPGVDLNFAIKLIEEAADRKVAEFSCTSSNSDTSSPDFSKEAFSGRVIIELGDPIEDMLPDRVIPELPMTDVSIERFYEWMRKIGLQYSNPFVLESIQRRLNLATVTTKTLATDQHVIHPATLDSVLQGLFAAFCYPGDGRMWTTYLPKSFRSIRFNMNKRMPNANTAPRLVADCYLTDSSARFMEGDIDVFSAEDSGAEIQFEGIVFSSLEVPTPANDSKMFYHTKWAPDIFSAIETGEEEAVNMPSAEVLRLHEACEKTASFYLNQLCQESARQNLGPTESQVENFIEWAHNRVGRENQSESLCTIPQDSSRAIDLQIIHQLGSKLPSRLGGSSLTSQSLGEDGLTEELFTQGLGFRETNRHLTSILETLAYQYPRMRVLEVGADSGEATSIALQHMGSKFEDYTYTDPSPAKVSAGQARFADQHLAIKFQTLDIEKSPTEQGFRSHSYDLVIACHPLHATKSIPDMVQHCRQLLRPGGFLLLAKLTSFDTLRIPLLLAGSPEWWRGPEEGSPTLTESEWDVVLRENHFSGVDVALRDFEDESMHSFSVMLSQATDERIDILRDPLNQVSSMVPMENLLVIGGRSLGVSKLAGKIRLLLSPFAKKVTLVDSIEDVLTNGLTYGSAVVYLSGLEEATFARMDEKRLVALQALFREAKYFLCVTRGSRLDDPYANLIVGIGRSVAREMAHLRLKFVDVNQFHLQKQLPEASAFSEMLLQMIYLDQPNFEDIMWSNENEIALDDGVTLIPRVFQDEKQNNALNSERRNITNPVPLKSSPVKVLTTEHGLILERTEGVAQDAGAKNSEILQVNSSSLFRFNFSDNDQPQYLVFGYSPEREKYVLALSETNGSILISADEQVSCEVTGGIDEILGAVIMATIWESLFSDTSGTIWIHNIDGSTLEIVERVAAHHQDVEVFLTTTDRKSPLLVAGKSSFVHPNVTERQLKALIPRKLRKFVQLGTEEDSITRLLPSLGGPRVDIRRGMISALNVSQVISLPCSRSNFKKMLENLCSSTCQFEELRGLLPTTTIKADQIHTQPDTASATSVISWTDVEEVQISAIQASKHRLFADNKTYFLVGLTGDVGFSLCDWMIDHGAKYIAIASRRPAVPPAVLSNFEKKGGTVRVFALDIGSMESLQSVHDHIVSTMPPIAGVANAALVVRDHPFDSMAFEDLQAVFGPKVVGTRNLDKLFYDTPLDFFILFSSIAGIVGKPAQSNYNATCLFMSTLAAQRRSRGYAASAMHFGMLLGFGFIHGQAGPTTEARFRQDDFMAIPEPHYHEIFAQAIISGRPDSGYTSDVIGGLGSEIDTPWRAMPRFWHCRFKGEENRAQDQNQDKKLPVKDQLKAAANREEALSIVKTALLGRVSVALGTRSEEVDDSIGLVSLGLDSLVAVEVRSWILKILDVDVPALKFLNGSSLSDICQDVLSKIPPELSPWQNEDNSDGGIKETKVNGIKTQKADSKSSQSTPPLVNGNGLEKKPIESVSEKPTVNGHHKLEISPEPKSYERVGDMSYAQSQLYFLHEYLNNNAHNIAYNGIFRGRINMERFQYALNVVGKRHEALRSAYYLDNSTSRPVQAVAAEPRIILEHRQISDRGEVEAEIESVKNFRFEIEKAIILKVTILSHSPSLHSIIFNHHHIALDGVGWNVFISELAEAYSGRLRAGTSSTTGILQSIDMAEQQLKLKKKESVKSDLAFWRGVYKTIPEPLPTFRFAKVATRPSTSDYAINTANVKLPVHISKLIEREASRIGVTAFHFYLASLATFLARCLAIEDISIGIVDANRTRAEEMQTIGYFLNMLPVRIRLEQSEAFDAVARKSRDAVLAASTHQSALFDSILSDLDVSRSTPHHPIFQVALNYRKAPLNETSFGTDGKIEWEGGVPGGNPYDLFLNVVSTADWTLLQFITQKSLYRASDGEMLLKWYSRALEALAANSSCEVGRCPVANELDIAEVTELGRGKEVEVPLKGTLVDHIEEMSRKFPESVAVTDDQGHTLTYSHMMARTNQIIRQLQAVSPPLLPGSYVAMLLDPGANAVCSILAILRLNLVWIPLDTLNHERRLGAVLKESQPQALIYHNSTAELMQRVSEGVDSVSVVNIDDVGTGHLEGEDLLLGPESHDDQLSKPALIIYTSGSTGTPKGVILTHQGLVNQIHGTSITLELGRETTLQHSPLGFDLMIDQIFLALCNGGTVAVVGRAGRGDPEYIADFMVQKKVSLTHFVPSEYLALLNYGHHILKDATSWRFALSGGEKLSVEARKAFRKLDLDSLNLVNVYGPAEISVACAKGIVPYRETVDISSDYLRTSPNYGITITDSNMNTLPVGFPGEICISGRGVGLGYLKRPEESSRKFVQVESGVPTRMYRSGDLGRILPDGTLNVLGRLDGDSQVKIRGFRVELGEIANALVQISNGVIVNSGASWRPDSEVLIAFVVFDVDYDGDKPQFIEWLRLHFPLPPAMKPTHIVAVDRIPATANGKIDQRAIDALPLPDSTDSTENEASSVILTSWEQKMKDIWEETLLTTSFKNKPNQGLIKPSSDFFQVGGNSILMIKLKSLIKVQLGVQVSMPELFHASTLSSMATLFEDMTKIGQEAPSTNGASFLESKLGQPAVNWDIEMAGLVHGLPQPRALSSSLDQKNSGLVVVLSGATGFIGTHLLSSLVEDPRIAQVHCIAIRPDAAGNPRHVSVKSEKITEYTGELSDLSLGLSDTEFKWLAEHAHVIIHNGAEVSLLKTYQTLRRANVISTRTLCEMAIPRRIPVHFVSTASVAKVMHLDGEPLLEVAPSPAVPKLLDSVDGYAASKWASEMLLENLAGSNGLSGYIHRLAHVVGENASELDAVGMLTKYSILMGAMPRISTEDVTGVWDFITVEDVVKDMIQSVTESTSTAAQSAQSSNQERHATFLNHCNSKKVPHEELHGYLEESAGEPLQVISMKEWLKRAEEEGMHPLVCEFYTAFDGGRGKIMLPVIAKP